VPVPRPMHARTDVPGRHDGTVSPVRPCLPSPGAAAVIGKTRRRRPRRRPRHRVPGGCTRDGKGSDGRGGTWDGEGPESCGRHGVPARGGEVGGPRPARRADEAAASEKAVGRHSAGKGSRARARARGLCPGNPIPPARVCRLPSAR
jgi:hypothetical protein